jgi:pimeloyl-ACP methyl ester carboxylesterase
MSSTTLVLFAISIACAGSVVVVFFLYKKEIRRSYDAVRHGSQVIDTEAGPIEYAEKGVGTPLLSIHGAGGGFDQGLALAFELVGSGFRIIAPSRFGYLRTPVPNDTSPRAQATAHAVLLAKLNVSKAIVLGVSAGARSAIEFSLRYPDVVACLILVVPGTYWPCRPVAFEGNRGSRFVFWIVNAGGNFFWWAAEKLAPAMLIRFLGVRPELVAAASPAERDRAMSIVRNVEPLSLRFPGINVDSTTELRELPLEKITAPTLIVSAADDGFNTLPAAEFAAKKIRDAKLVVYDTGGHLLVGHQNVIRTTIRNFVAFR